ncbi:hypothetical protein QBC39DRAFT_372848 [Podospora conica]|nr:hypothetical protein QBC39DRAFT_372848 [Schizothecium conicum]
MPRPSTVLICFDGTWCTADEGSNVHRIYQHAQVTDNQAKYYVDGLGTDGGWKDSVAGGAWGKGIEKKLWKAYHELQASLVKKEDRLVVVGFSRGAFTACVFAVFLAEVGLHRKLTEAQFLELFDKWRKRREKGKDTSTICKDAGLDASRFRCIRTQALGLFDTVAALDGTRPAFMSAADRENLAFVDEGVLHAADHIFQALALLERRRDFEPCVFRETGSCLVLRQCWFVGCHADVGGDRGNKHPLHHFPLLWMMNNLRPFVTFAETRVFQHILHDLKPILRVYAGETFNDKDQEWVDSYYANKLYKLAGSRPRVDALTSSMGNISLGQPSSSSSPRAPSLKSRIARAFRPPPSILADLEDQAAEAMTTDMSSLTPSITTIHWTAAMFEAWIRSSFTASHSPLAGYTRSTIFSSHTADGDGQQAAAGNMGSLEGTTWQSTSADAVCFWEEPLTELEGDFMVQGYGAKYGADEVELFFNDAAQAGLDPSDAGFAAFDDRHEDYQSLDRYDGTGWEETGYHGAQAGLETSDVGATGLDDGRENYQSLGYSVAGWEGGYDAAQAGTESWEAGPTAFSGGHSEQLNEDFDAAVLEEEEHRAGQIYLPLSGEQIRRVNEGITNAGLGDATLTFEQKQRYLEGRGQRYRY